MPDKNYYLVLGVPQNASAAGIRRAYLKLAKTMHPDRAGLANTSAFQEVKEAYEALSDPEHRKRHNRELALRQAKRGPRSSFEHRPPRTEPIVPPRFSSDEGDALFPRYTAPRARRTAASSRPAAIELVLTPREAAWGGTFRFSVPLSRSCIACGGGPDWLLGCRFCGGQGVIEIHETAAARVPPGVRSGTVFELRTNGARLLNVLINVEDH